MKQDKQINVLKSIMLFVLPLLTILSCKNDNDPKFIDYHQTAVKQSITVGKTSFAYKVPGNKTGMPLVMVSALGFSMDDWDAAITNGLAQLNKIIIFDIEDAGSSNGTTPDNIADMAKGVVSFIKALGYNKVNLMGFSLGSFISQQIVLTGPALVNKLILTGTWPKGPWVFQNFLNYWHHLPV